jgi:GR25 family glycosyltransferase involved in LPS biosynthesis
MNYQIIIISICEKRKEMIKKQLEMLNLTDIQTVYINPATIENSKQYLPKDITDENTLKIICKTLSHLYCLEYAGLKSSPEYSIILEDDVAFHKIHFRNAIEEIISQWDSSFPHCKMVSIGWIPMNRKFVEEITTFKRLYYSTGSRIIHLYACGSQGYIVRKKDIANEIKNLLYPTYDELKTYISQYKETHKIQHSFDSVAVDGFLNTILNQHVLYPPLLIEQKMPSHVGHNNWSYWNNYFNSPYHKRLDEYLLLE